MSLHTISVLVEDKPGVLTRVAGLFAARGFNIDSLAVGPTSDDGLSRMTIVVHVDRKPLEQSAMVLAREIGPDCDVVLLGSIASPKYVDVLLGVFGLRLRFPLDFVGRGDMSRGGLLLRRASDGQELEYAPIAGAVLHGARPPKLPPLRRAAFPSPV